MTFLAQTEVPGIAGADAVGRMARRALHPGLVRGQFRGHDAALEQRPVQVDTARALPPVGRHRYAIPSSSGRTSTQ